MINTSYKELKMTKSIEKDIGELINFFDNYGIDYNKFSQLDFSKRQAYPNTDVYSNIPQSYDTKKWLQTIKEIYNGEANGVSRVVAIKHATNGWNIVETFNFLNWVKFYEGGNHMKYKFAQLWYENPETPGYFLNIKKDVEQAKPEANSTSIDFAKQESVQDVDKKERIEKQRNKIIGRLDSVEKLLRSKDGHLFSGKEFESLLQSIFDLKKKIHLVNKISVSTKLYQDMIVREANVLYKNGFKKAADVLYSTAASPPLQQSAQNSTKLTEVSPAKVKPTEAKPTEAKPTSTTPAPTADPSGAGSTGIPAGTPNMGNAGPPTMPTSPPNNTPNLAGSGKGGAVKEFMSKLDGANKDELSVEDDLEVYEDNELLSEAQFAPQRLGIDEPMTNSPAPSPLKPSPVKAPTLPPPLPPLPDEEPLEVTSDEPLEISDNDLTVPETSELEISKDFDKKMDAAFANITVADVVSKLEDLAKIFKTREVPRQLGVVDMMLDSLGLASFFPALSEAHNKSLESNNYISTRIDEVLSKLRGSMTANKIDLKGELPNEHIPAEIKEKLQSDENKDLARKQNKKELELNSKPTPQIDVQKDLREPVINRPSANVRPPTI